MKKLLFIGIVVLMVESLGAVTLPSTSYSPYSASTPSEESFSTLGGSVVTGSYSNLGSYTPGTCYPLDDTEYLSCATCCKSEVSGYSECVNACTNQACVDECAASTGYTSCINDCEHGPSVPLDGGLSILLILSLAGGAFKLLRNRKNA